MDPAKGRLWPEEFGKIEDGEGFFRKKAASWRRCARNGDLAGWQVGSLAFFFGLDERVLAQL